MRNTTKTSASLTDPATESTDRHRARGSFLLRSLALPVAAVMGAGTFMLHAPGVAVADPSTPGASETPSPVATGSASSAEKEQVLSAAQNLVDGGYPAALTAVRDKDGNTIREFTTFNLGTVTGIGETRIGDDNWIMAYCHLAHDCVVGNHTIFANNASLAGHVTIGDYVVLGGYTLVFQFCRIGDYAMTAFAAGVHKDVPPYFMASGYRAEPAGLNSEGMRRNGFTAEQISAVKDVYKTLYHRGIPFEEAKADILRRAETQAELAVFRDFFAQSTRGIIR